MLTGCNGGSSVSTVVGDPLFAGEWHLENTGQLGFIGVDMDVARVWASGDRRAGNHHRRGDDVHSAMDYTNPDYAKKLRGYILVDRIRRAGIVHDVYPNWRRPVMSR